MNPRVECRRRRRAYLVELCHLVRDAVIASDARRKTRVLPGRGPVCGVEVELSLDESRFTGSAYLFAAVLDRFFATHTTLNSFTTTRALLHGRAHDRQLLEQWPPRTGRAHTL